MRPLYRAGQRDTCTVRSQLVNINEPHISAKVFIVVASDNCSQGRMAQSVARMTQEPEVPGRFDTRSGHLLQFLLLLI